MIDLLERPEQVLVALEPLRRELLARLAEPASATEIAAELGMGRQKVAYHLKALEQAGLIGLVEERPRRGCTERVLQATAEAFVVDPAVVSPELPDDRDRHAAGHLVAVAADTVRQVARQQVAAAARDERLITFTVEAEAAFDTPADLEAFTDALVEAVEATTARFHTPGGRRYRVVIGGHPAPPRTPTTDTEE